MDDARMMFDRRIPSSRHENSSSALPLPLNLIALIISFLDDPADLGRTCRTCRLFHYMTLPSLYSSVSLRSYDYIRYTGYDGLPQGVGMASPFSMGLSGLATRNVASYVKSFEVCGQWKEYELQQHASVGRVPDETMLMNSLVRVAVERMECLEEFRWEMVPKMLPTMWQGLSQKPSLKRLTVKFPSSRDPRPMTVAPPIPSLEYLHIHDIDPLCYGDDISNLLLGSKDLKHLKLHWSPRMRREHEPSTHHASYFGKVDAANYTMSLKSLAFSNYFVSNQELCRPVTDCATIEDITMLNSTFGLGDRGGAAFMESDSWRDKPECGLVRLKSLRVDKISPSYHKALSTFDSLERLYFVSGETAGNNSKTITNGNTSNGTIFSLSPASSHSSHGYCDIASISSLKDAYLDVITKTFGPRLKHLLLLPHWRLNDDDMAKLVRKCPNIEQLAIGVEFASLDQLRLLLPFLSKLQALRLLCHPEDPAFAEKMKEVHKDRSHDQKLADSTADVEWNTLRWVEFGPEDVIFELGHRYRVGTDEQGKARYSREVYRRPRSAVMDVAIWKADSHEL